MLQNLANDKKAIKALEMVGPELFKTSGGGDVIGDFVLSSSLGGSISDQVISCLSDAEPSTIDT